MKRLFFLSVILVLLASCSSTERVSYSQSTLDSFVGQTHEELVQRLGAPTESVPDGGEGYILVYEGNKDIFRYSSKYASKSGTLPKAQLYMSNDALLNALFASDPFASLFAYRPKRGLSFISQQLHPQSYP